MLGFAMVVFPLRAQFASVRTFLASLCPLLAIAYLSLAELDAAQAQNTEIRFALLRMQSDGRVACLYRQGQKNSVVMFRIRGARISSRPVNLRRYRKIIVPEIKNLARKLVNSGGSRANVLANKLASKKQALRTFPSFSRDCPRFLPKDCVKVTSDGVCELGIPGAQNTPVPTAPPAPRGTSGPTPTRTAVGTPTSPTPASTPTSAPTPTNTATRTPTPTPTPRIQVAVRSECPQDSYPICRQGRLLRTGSADLPADEQGVVNISQLRWDDALLVNSNTAVGATITVTLGAGTQLDACTLGGTPLGDCASGVTIPSLSEGVFPIEVRVHAGTLSSVVTLPVLAYPIVPTGRDLGNAYGARFLLRNSTSAQVSQEPDYVAVATGSTLHMPGRNFCIHRTAADSCSVVLAEGSRLFIGGSNVGVSAERAFFYLSNGSISTISGSNFFPQEIRIAPGAIVFSGGSNFFPVVVRRFDSSITDVTTCPLFRDGSCPSNLEIIE